MQPAGEHPHGLSDKDFDSLFTKDRPIIFNFHGYPWLIHRLAYRRTNHANLHVRGYKEKGNINTPLELAIENEIDRFSLAIDVINRVPRLQVAGAHVKEKLRDMQIDAPQLRLRARDRPARVRRLGVALLGSVETNRGCGERVAGTAPPPLADPGCGSFLTAALGLRPETPSHDEHPRPRKARAHPHRHVQGGPEAGLRGQPLLHPGALLGRRAPQRPLHGRRLHGARPPAGALGQVGQGLQGQQGAHRLLPVRRVPAGSRTC